MRRGLILIMLLITIAGCKKRVYVPYPPTKSTLVFPAKDAACTTGTIISASQNTVLFQWNASEITDSYELHIKNLLTNASTATAVTTNQLNVTLTRNTPYSWFVISLNNASTERVQSDVWKFYNSGPGISSYAPYPAEILTPAFGQSVTATANKLNLDWNGSDVDNDIATYDVYFGTTATPTVFKSAITESIVLDVPVTSGNTYYWRVVTKDKQGNTSDSGIYQFRVN